MRLKVKEQIKTLLSQEGMTQKSLVELMNKENKNKYSTTSLSQRLTRGSFTYNEVLKVAEILGYDIQFLKINK